MWRPSLLFTWNVYLRKPEIGGVVFFSKYTLKTGETS